MENTNEKSARIEKPDGAKDTVTVSINEEQEKVINTLEEVLKFLKSVRIKNEESLDNIKKPLDDLQSSLKFLPIEPSLSVLPTEIQTDILDYLCDSEAFVAASVCEKWKGILKSRFENDSVILGKHCSNENECDDFTCYNPIEMLKASAVLKLDVTLIICHPVMELNAEIIAEGLAGVSHLAIEGGCECNDNHDVFSSNDQLEDLLEGIEKSEKILNCLGLWDLHLVHLNQEKLVNCLLTKTKKLLLSQDPDLIMLNVEMLIEKLLQDLPEHQLSSLALNRFEYSDELGEDMADALCKIENIQLTRDFPLKPVTTKKLIKNILTGPIKTKSLIIKIEIDFRTLISPEDLRKLIEEFGLLRLRGTFTPEQLEAVRAVAEVKEKQSNDVVSSAFISKGQWAW